MDTVLMTIQEAANETGLTEHTLRYYERIGLIESVDRAQNGHRRYSRDDLGWIDMLKCLRATGMPVSQMLEFAQMTRSGEDTIPDRLELLEAHRCDVLQQIEQLQRHLTKIDHKINYYNNLQGELACKES